MKMHTDVQEQSFIELRCKTRPIRVLLKDGSHTTMLVDDTRTVDELAAYIIEKLGVDNCSDLSVIKTNRGGMTAELASGGQTLREQG